MVDLSINALVKIIFYVILFVIVSLLAYSYKTIKNVHIVMVFILILVLILKNSIKQN